MPYRLNRESRENRERSRRCNPAFSIIIGKEPLSVFDATVPNNRDGKAAEGAGESEDLPDRQTLCGVTETRGRYIHGAKKTGCSPSSDDA